MNIKWKDNLLYLKNIFTQKNIIIGVTVIFSLVTILFYVENYTDFGKDILKNNIKGLPSNGALSYMIETGFQTGEYEVSNDVEWDLTKHEFNSSLSKCDNGGTVTWDNEKQKVVIKANISNRCYVYFDALQPKPTLAKYIKSIYTTDGENGLYLHDADLANGANDGSYRYAGASEDVNNYVCFASDAEICPDDNLYRIIGVFGDNVKLIKSDYATSAQLGTDGDYYRAYNHGSSTYKGANYANVASYYWDSTNEENIWANSALNTVNLNTNYIAYLNGINTKWANMIAETTWKVGGNTLANIGISSMNVAYQNEIVNPAESTTYTDEIGLMYVSDYGYAAAPSNWTSTVYDYDADSVTSSNWMYMGLYEWTISRISDDYFLAFFVYNHGRVDDSYVFNDFAVRPSFSLKSTVQYSGVGTGSSTAPYRITLAA